MWGALTGEISPFGNGLAVVFGTLKSSPNRVPCSLRSFFQFLVELGDGRTSVLLLRFNRRTRSIVR